MMMDQKEWNNVVRQSLKHGYQIVFETDERVTYPHGGSDHENMKTILYNMPNTWRNTMEDMIEQHDSAESGFDNIIKVRVSDDITNMIDEIIKLSQPEDKLTDRSKVIRKAIRKLHSEIKGEH